MKITEITTTVCEMPDGFMIDIIEQDNRFEAYLYHKSYGIKSFMYGLLKSDADKAAFIENVECNFNEYKEMYKSEYMQA